MQYSNLIPEKDSCSFSPRCVEERQKKGGGREVKNVGLHISLEAMSSPFLKPELLYIFDESSRKRPLTGQVRDRWTVLETRKPSICEGGKSSENRNEFMQKAIMILADEITIAAL